MCVEEEEGCGVRVFSESGELYVVKVDRCLNKRVKDLQMRKVCDYLIISQNTIYLLELKCGTVRPGDEEEVREKFDNVEDFLRRMGITAMVKRILYAKKLSSMVSHNIKLVRKKIRGDIFTEYLRRFETGGSLILEAV